jgi:hypothetical protein
MASANVIAGAPFYDGGNTSEGAALVFVGGAAQRCRG